MLSQMFTKQKVNFYWLIVLLVLLVGCQPSGGITIAQNDNTPPTLTLGAGQSGGHDVTVSAGGTAQNMNLISKTGMLNLLATANDPESGVQAVEIWVSKRTTFCDANVCTTTGPGLLGQPMFESTSPQKQPGETTAASSILAQSLDLAMEISQGSISAGQSLTVDLIISAVAVNHLGGRTQTPEITVTWTEQ